MEGDEPEVDREQGQAAECEPWSQGAAAECPAAAGVPPAGVLTVLATCTPADLLGSAAVGGRTVTVALEVGENVATKLN